MHMCRTYLLSGSCQHFGHAKAVEQDLLVANPVIDICDVKKCSRCYAEVSQVVIVCSAACPGEPLASIS